MILAMPGLAKNKTGSQSCNAEKWFNGFNCDMDSEFLYMNQIPT